MDNKVKAYLQAFGVSEATQRFLSKPQRMFIGGAWLEASDGGSAEVVEPSTEGVLTRIPMGTQMTLTVRCAPRVRSSTVAPGAS